MSANMKLEANPMRPQVNGGGDLRAGAVSDLELLAIILGRGRAGGRHWQVARELLARATLGELLVLDAAGILEVPRLGSSAQVLLHASLELGRRLTDVDGGRRVLSHAADVHAVARDLELARREHFVAFLLDARNRVLARETISIGTLSASLVHPREVFGPAIECRAASVIVVHNHPSGDPEPSADDLALTRRLVQAGTLIGIEVLDHLVIGYGSYVSLKSRGLM
jgi:DNA repair protein RadC